MSGGFSVRNVLHVLLAFGCVWSMPASTIGSECAQVPEIQVPDGFCVTTYATQLGPARHLTVSDSGDVYVSLSSVSASGSIVALRDVDGDGVADLRAGFGTRGGDDIEWHEGELFATTTTSVTKYKVPRGDLVPDGPAVDVAQGFLRFESGEHDAKSIAFRGRQLFVSVGAPSNACQENNRRVLSIGASPCPLLEHAGGVWEFRADRLGQEFATAPRFSTGIRHVLAMGVERRSGGLYALQQGRDMLSSLWPDRFSAEQNAELPSEEVLRLMKGRDFGWPYCFHDPFQGRRVLAPEYGGDGINVGSCGAYAQPEAVLPAHTSPVDIAFIDDVRWPERYRYGAFIALHGGWGREPFRQRGYEVIFMPFGRSERLGGWRSFVRGFAGGVVDSPSQARYRPVGLALDRKSGVLFISDSKTGRVWRVKPS